MPPPGVLAYHPPCTLQHGQKLRGGVEQHLAALGFEVRVAMNESHLCCGSAGTYSVLHPEIAHTLRDRKLGHLGALEPAAILSANIGCIRTCKAARRRRCGTGWRCWTRRCWRGEGVGGRPGVGVRLRAHPDLHRYAGR